MAKYYIYDCRVSELDIENNKITEVFNVHSEHHKPHGSPEEAFKELRDILDKRCDAAPV